MSPLGGFGLITMTKPTAIISVSSCYYDFYCIYETFFLLPQGRPASTEFLRTRVTALALCHVTGC